MINYGKEYLKAKLNNAQSYIKTRYDYYDMKNVHNIRSLSIPNHVLQEYMTKLGWCAKAVDLLADRLVVNRFRNDDYNMQQLFDMNNSDILFGSAIKGALISACDFIYLYKDDEENVRMQVVGGKNATGILDDTTSLLKEGYAVLSRDSENNNVLKDAYFTTEYTEYCDYENKEVWRVPNNTNQCLLVPIINDPKQGTKSFGNSRISRNMMRTQDQAEELMARLNVLAEVNSWPQKWVTGLSESTDMDNLKATFSSMLRFDKDEDGDRPTLGQFTQMSFADHINAFDTYVSMFSGMSSLTRDDLGFVTENPSSAESKKAALESLRVIAGKCQHDFSVGFINTGFVGTCLREEAPLKREIIRNTKVIWKPLVEPDASTLSSIGDGVIKINQAIEGFITPDILADLIGIDGASEVTDGGLFNFSEFGAE
ncbi:MAG: hypothetical protein Q4A15_00485 [Prevotellaceae bacterium]|nr:hypothetical protein [Prevotellaceae bacterium]